MLQRLRLAARGLFRKTVVERELDEELRFHLDRETELNISRGMTPVEARRRALVALGGLEPTKEIQREGRQKKQQKKKKQKKQMKQQKRYKKQKKKEERKKKQ